MDLNFSAMILAAGYGKRMMPLTKDIPKPLLKINGITLLENSILFLKKLGCNQIIINTHYKHLKIKSLINKLKDKNIMTLYENEILDTGGGVKNAIPFFKNKNLLITNSDVFWLNKNIQDAKKLIENYFINRKPHMLLINKNNAIGLNNKEGDFILNDNKILRFKKGDKIFFYSGLQMLSTNIFDIFDKKNFSFNDVWDYLILKKELNGHVMKSNCYHVGDIQGLNIAKDIES